MEFCKSCNNILLIRQYIDSETDIKQLIYYCEQCNFEKNCNETCVYKKTYKQNNKTSVNLLNKNQVNDPTLPTMKIKCPKCKKVNINPYTISYTNNAFRINLICKKCYFSWTKK
jgi:DNA-directed RNA polymerase subunit M/transcription elongation factor TFIIS